MYCSEAATNGRVHEEHEGLVVRVLPDGLRLRLESPHLVHVQDFHVVVEGRVLSDAILAEAVLAVPGAREAKCLPPLWGGSPTVDSGS